MQQPASNFDALEKQLAKDALEKALKDLHSEITREIERNKTIFSDEIKKSLSNLNETLEKHISDEIDHKLPLLLAKNFSNVSEQVKSSFNEMLVPVVEKAEQNMEQLKSQGDKTLQSWATMMKKYESLWTTPFFLVLAASVLTGTAIFLILFFMKTSVASYIFMDVRARKAYESDLRWVELREKARAEQEKASPSPKTQNKKKQK